MKLERRGWDGMEGRRERGKQTIGKIVAFLPYKTKQKIPPMGIHFPP